MFNDTEISDSDRENLSHTFYNDKTWHSYTLHKEDPKKYMNHVKPQFC